MPNYIYFDGERFLNNTDEPDDPDQKVQLMQGYDHYTKEEIALITQTLNNSNVVGQVKQACKQKAED